MAHGLGFFDLLAFVTFSINALSYAMRDIKWLRIITIIAMLGDLVVYYNIRPGSPLWVQFGMSALIIVINTYQLYMLWREKQASHFPGDTGWLYEHVFALLSPGEFKRVLKLGRWSQLQEGEYVLHKGGVVDEVGFVIEGRLDATWGDTVLNTVTPGGLVGEISYLTGKHASADVSAGTDTRLFVLTHGVLDKIKLERPDLHTKLMYVLGREVAQKLANSNHLVTASRF
ncbi:Crp/Fnr family transcriptional regulator [Hydrogenophaga sp. OTU3427]|uniref:Crp/Fnr family transcriptional regulator n=1 Tax=Hydrogenophaga sp. OTU3427 TaxID=3043856 RepID=UPI00313B17CF